MEAAPSFTVVTYRSHWRAYCFPFSTTSSVFLSTLIVSLVQMFETLSNLSILNMDWRVVKNYGETFSQFFSALKDVSYPVNCYWGEGLSHEVKAGFTVYLKVFICYGSKRMKTIQSFGKTVQNNQCSNGEPNELSHPNSSSIFLASSSSCGCRIWPTSRLFFSASLNNISTTQRFYF